MRRAAKVDRNQAEIVEALRAIGASVYVIKEPVDLMVGFRKKTVALEVKNGPSWRLTPQQEKFFHGFEGEAYLVENVHQALEAVRGK